jgi:hypothetical protein
VRIGNAQAPRSKPRSKKSQNDTNFDLVAATFAVD